MPTLAEIMKGGLNGGMSRFSNMTLIPNIAPVTRTLPNGGGTYVAPGPKQQTKQIFQGASPVVTPPSINPDAEWYKPDGGRYTVNEVLANRVAKMAPADAIPTYVGNSAVKPDQTVEEMNRTNAGMTNSSNDIATGATDPYKVGSKSGIAYSPAELKAIEKAYAGIYDPAINDVFNKLNAKQKEEERAQANKDKLSQMAQQHIYDMELKRTPTAAEKNAAEASAYNGDFAGTIGLIAGMESSVYAKKQTAEVLQNLIKSKDYPTAYATIANTVENALTGTPKIKFADARTDYGVMEGMKQAVQEYAKNGGDMGLLVGTEEEIKRKLGVDTSRASPLATQLWREFQTYRNNMTGAAFGVSESRDYASVNPSLGKSLNLNLSVIQGAQDQLKNRVNKTIDERIPSAQYIRQYAEGATGPTTAPAPVNDPEVLKWLQDNGLAPK